MRKNKKQKTKKNTNLQKFPMSKKESRVLPDNVHNITGNNSFVVFSSNFFTQGEEFANDCDNKVLFVFFEEGAADGAERRRKKNETKENKSSKLE